MNGKTLFVLFLFVVLATCQEAPAATAPAEKYPIPFNVPQAYRPSRVPSGSFRTCGRRLNFYVWKVCGGTCDTYSNNDIATSCCRGACTDEFIRESCCADQPPRLDDYAPF